MVYVRKHPLALTASLTAALLFTAIVAPRIVPENRPRPSAVLEDDAPKRGDDRGQSAALRIGPKELLAIDPVYHQIAAATGGDVSLWSPGEFADSEPILRLGGEDLLLAYENLGRLSGGTQRSHSFAVDALTGRLDVFLSAQLLGAATLWRPSGEAVSLGQSGVDLRRFDRMLQIAVECPTSGVWRLDWTGTGLSSLSARASGGSVQTSGDPRLEPIQWIAAEFVEEGGRPGHTGLFPLGRSVLAGEDALLRLTLSGSRLTTEVLLVGSDGSALDERVFVPVEEPGSSPDGGLHELFVELTIPEREFRVLVRGIDPLGAPYQRISPASIDPETE